MPDVEPQEIEALGEVANMGFGFRQSQSSCPQPRGQEVLSLDRRVVGRTQDRQIISVSQQGICPTKRASGCIRTPQGVHHAMERHVQQQRAAYTPYKVANPLLEFSMTIPRTQLRPSYGEGFLGAPLQLGTRRDAPMLPGRR